MLKEIQEYLDALYIIESLVNDKLENNKLISTKNKIEFCSLTASYEERKSGFKMMWQPRFTVAAEPDFTISFIGSFGSWDGPFEKNFDLYAEKHVGYKSKMKVPNAKRHRFFFNFNDVESFKVFFETYYWRDYVAGK